MSEASSSRLAFEAGQPVGIVLERARQDFDRDLAAQPRVARAIHLAHPADAQQPLHLEDADAPAGEQHARRRDEPGHERADRRVDHAGRRLRQQRLDLAPQRRIVRARAREPRVALGGRPLARLVKQPFDLAQALRRHIYGFPGAIVRR